MGESIAAYNDRIRRENPDQSIHELPPFFAIKHPKDETISVLLEANPAFFPGIWTLNIVEYPSQFLDGAYFNESGADTWLGCATHTIFVQRPSKHVEKNNKLQPVQLRFAKMVLELPDGESIPYFKMTSPCIALSSTFSQLTRNCPLAAKEKQSFVPSRRPQQQSQEQNPRPLRQSNSVRNLLEEINNIATRTQDLWTRIQTQERRVEESGVATQQQRPTTAATTTTTAPTAKMPQHVVNIFIESLIAKKESCPITMEPLTKEGACLTPCGHGVGLSAAEHWIRGAHSCPVCRLPCELSSLQHWKSS